MIFCNFMETIYFITLDLKLIIRLKDPFFKVESRFHDFAHKISILTDFV